MTHIPRYPLLCMALLATTALSGCNNVSPMIKPAQSLPVVKTATILTPAVQMVIGDYVSAGYAKRAQGYDWVAVSVSPNGANAITIKVRARSDIKKPTCTFDGQATLMGQDTAHGIIFQTTINNSMAFFQFKEDALGDSKLIIDSQDKYALNHFCSGGGSIVGDYQKLTGDLELN